MIMHLERGSFLDQGFVNIPNFFTISEMYDASLDAYKAVQIARELDSTHFVQGAKFVKPMGNAADEVCLRIEWVKHLFKGISGITGHKRLSSLLKNLCDCKKFDEIICQLNYRIPNDQTSYPIHRDLQLDKGMFLNESDIQHSALVAIGLGESNQYSSPLILFPKSHKENFEYKADDLRLEDGLSMPLGLGDIVVFHPALLHGSGPNPTNLYRHIALSLFVPKGSYRRSSPDFSI
jgi:hypothetical protein